MRFPLFIAVALGLLLFSACEQQSPAVKPVPNQATLAANNDSYSLEQSSILLITATEGVLANDTLAKDYSLSLSQTPEHGTIELNQDGSFRYAHKANAPLDDLFAYSLSAQGVTVSAQVTLTINPSSETAEPKPSEPLPETPTPVDPSEPIAAPLCPESLQAGDFFECRLEPETSLLNGPTGMVLNQRSGFIRWTPTEHQVGSYAITILRNNEQQSFNLAVTQGKQDPAGIYVAPNGNDSHSGSAAEPFKTLQHAVDSVQAGMTIFVRGGNYYHPNYAQTFDGSRSSNAIAKITTSGTKEAPISLRAYGNEFVKLITDEDGIILSDVAHWTLEGIELEGSTQSLSLDDALATWWADDASKTTGRGITNRRSQHISIVNCIIHDFPGAGVGSNGSDYVSVQDSLIYNNGWWSTAGTHGVANSYLTTTDPNSAEDEKLILERNLVFGNQSLVISHVFSKGKVAMVLDEGNGLNAQNNRVTLIGKARIEQNLMLFNGKAGFGINTMDDIIVRNNSFYKNARVVQGAADLTIQSSLSADISANLFDPREDRSSIKDFQKRYDNVGLNASTQAHSDLSSNMQVYPSVFMNPEALDFRSAEALKGMGVSDTVLTAIFEKVDAYGVEILEPSHSIDDAYMHAMKQVIFDAWPKAHASLILEDKETKFNYTYAQRCHYPNEPTAEPCF